MSLSTARPIRPDLATLIDAERDALDRLCAEVAGGVRGASHYDALEQRADGIGRGLRAAFRQARPEVRR